MNNIKRAEELVGNELFYLVEEYSELFGDEQITIVEALAKDGLIAKDLPEPDESEDPDCLVWHPNHNILTLGSASGAAFETERPIGQVWTDIGGIIGMDTDHSEMHLSPEDARALAYALLAAAESAEETK